MPIRVFTRLTESFRLNISRNITGIVKSKREIMQQSKRPNSGGVMAWIDLEMTGLDIDTCHILEVVCLISDKDLNIISDELHFVIHQPDSILDNMNTWCMTTHSKTGLIEASRQSKLTEKDAEQLLLAHLQKYTKKSTCLMAGNTVYMDRIFINKYMPSVNNYLHYRLVDISTIKELARLWAPEIHQAAPRKLVEHKAMSDIKESIEELKFYRRYMFGSQAR